MSRTAKFIKGKYTYIRYDGVIVKRRNKKKPYSQYLLITGIWQQIHKLRDTDVRVMVLELTQTGLGREYLRTRARKIRLTKAEKLLFSLIKG